MILSHLCPGVRTSSPSSVEWTLAITALSLLRHHIEGLKRTVGEARSIFMPFPIGFLCAIKVEVTVEIEIAPALVMALRAPNRGNSGFGRSSSGTSSQSHCSTISRPSARIKRVPNRQSKSWFACLLQNRPATEFRSRHDRTFPWPAPQISTCRPSVARPTVYVTVQPTVSTNPYLWWPLLSLDRVGRSLCSNAGDASTSGAPSRLAINAYAASASIIQSA
jgi:hypothetical protein